MNMSLNRYNKSMLVSLSSQSVPSLFINAALRGVAFTLFLQIISLASVGQMSGILQMALLAFIFGFIIFSIDLIERAWAQFSLRKRLS